MISTYHHMSMQIQKIFPGGRVVQGIFKFALGGGSGSEALLLCKFKKFEFSLGSRGEAMGGQDTSLPSRPVHTSQV